MVTITIKFVNGPSKSGPLFAITRWSLGRSDLTVLLSTLTFDQTTSKEYTFEQNTSKEYTFDQNTSKEYTFDQTTSKEYTFEQITFEQIDLSIQTKMNSAYLACHLILA